MGKKQKRNRRLDTSVVKTVENYQERIDDSTGQVSCQNLGKLNDKAIVLESCEIKKIDLNSRTKARVSFLSNLCHVCKNTMADINCPKCQLIRYCSVEHRKKHWPSHAEICQAVQRLKSRDKVDHVFSKAINLTPKDFREFRYNLLLECQSVVERPFELWEREMFLFPAVCDTCYCPVSELLCVCDECSMASSCPQHVDKMLRHKANWCFVLKLLRDFNAHELKNGVLEILFPLNFFRDYSRLPETIDGFFKSWNLNVNIYQQTQLTEISTAPLTILFGAEDILDPSLDKRTEFVIHLIGAEIEFELEPIHKWELFFQHLLPTLKTLRLVMIGPELFQSGNSEEFVSCSECVKHGKTLNVAFESGLLYHEYTVTDQYVQPDIICIFNPGLSRLTGFNEQDSWSDTISVMFQENVPVIMTAYTEYEIFSDLKRIQETVHVNILKKPQKNSYSSQKPYRNFISDDCVPVIFKNYYVCVLSPQK